MDVVVPRVDRPLAGIKTRQRCVCRLCPAGWWLYVDIYCICIIYVNILSAIHDTYDVSVVRYMHILYTYSTHTDICVFHVAGRSMSGRLAVLRDNARVFLHVDGDDESGGSVRRV